MARMQHFDTVDDYINQFPTAVQQNLQKIRKAILSAAPGATEKISYGMPAYQLHGVLVYFGAYEKHIGFYPTGSGITAFKTALTDYKTSKGTVQFPIPGSIPLTLIKKIVAFRVVENNAKLELKQRKKTK